MLKKAYRKTMKLAGHPKADRWLFSVSFIESSVFPIPPDIMLIPMCLEKREKAFYFAFLCTIGSVLGGLAGYAIGMFFWAAIGDPLMTFYGLEEEFAVFQREFSAQGFLWVFVFGITMFPYKVITIASGLVGLNPFLFILASITSRGIRFFIEAALLWKYGEKVREFVEKRLALSMTLAILIVLAILLGLDMLRG